jgi:hypothetical protein
MNWRTIYPQQHTADWADLERALGQLPPRLGQQALALTANLSISYSPSGLLRDLLTRPGDYALPYLHDMLIRDWQLALPEAVSRHLFHSAVYTFMADYAASAGADRDMPLAESFVPLQHLFTQQAARRCALLFAETSPFWIEYETCWNDWAAAQLQPAEDWRAFGSTPAGGWQTGYAAHLKHRLAPYKLGVCGAALLAGHQNRLPEIHRLLDALHVVVQLRAEVLAARRDLKRGRFTYPIIHTLLATQIDPQSPLNADWVLGAMLLSGALKQVCADALVYAAGARVLAGDLNLPAFSAYLIELEDDLRGLQDLFTLGQPANSNPPGGFNPSKESTPAFAPAVDSIIDAIRLAEKYLLADRAFTESWEVQRRGAQEPRGAPESRGAQDLIGKAFPMGLIAEILGQHDHAVGDVVDEVFRTLHSSGFQYYTDPIGWPDADDLGLLLRLLRYSDHLEEHRHILQTPLSWLKDRVNNEGLIPVWLTKPEPSPASSTRVWGNHCATVTANMLLGLLDYESLFEVESLVEAELMARAAAHWLARWRRDGLGATAYYVPGYAMWTTLKLLDRLAVRWPEWSAALEAAARPALERLSLDAQRATLMPQTAAFLILATSYPATRQLFSDRWITYLIKTQRYDGSWPAEALYLTPTRGAYADWYSSRTVTTAFCYHALATAARRMPAAAR